MTLDAVLDAILKLSAAFRNLNMQPPEVLLLSRPEDGRRLHGYALQLLDDNPGTSFVQRPPEGDIATVVEHADGSVWMEIQFMGTKVRWPAKKHPTDTRGGFLWG